MSPRDAFGRVQTVLLLGGNSDIGRAIVGRMVENGARRLILAGRHPERSPTKFDAELDHRPFDATDTASHRKFFEEVFDEHPVDVVVIAFGVLEDQHEIEANPELGLEMAEVNYVGAMSALLHAASHLRARGGGDIVLLSSVAGTTPRKSNYVYGSSKAGVDFLARGLASSLEGSDVHLLIVRPGFVHSSMTRGMPARPFAVSPDTVAQAAVDALARRDDVIWVPGILRWVMAILRLLPGRFVDRLEA